jgi:mRNA-degrading endonuclease RelE of RelBE toxin-antitoxin system
MNLQTDVFPLLKNNDLMIKSPTTTVGKNPSERFPDNEWIYTDDFSPSWRGQYPNSFIPRWDVNPLMEGSIGWGLSPVSGPPILVPIPQPSGIFDFPDDQELNVQWLDQEIEKTGTEALAWYRPFHLSPQRLWGITITDRGIWKLARDVFAVKYNKPYSVEEIEDCRDLAFQFLYSHELFHFRVEFAATVMELNNPSRHDEPIYARHWDGRMGGTWFRSPSNILNGDAPLEEALANEYGYWISTRGQPYSVKKALRKFMDTMPPGYRSTEFIRHNRNWGRGLDELAEQLLDHPTPMGWHSFQWPSGMDAESMVPCEVLDSNMSSVFQIRKLSLNPYWEVSKKFRKDLRKLPRDVRLDFHSSVDEATSRDGEVNPNRMPKKLKGKKNKLEYRVSKAYRVYISKLSDGSKLFERIAHKSKQSRIIKSL